MRQIWPPSYGTSRAGPGPCVDHQHHDVAGEQPAGGAAGDGPRGSRSGARSRLVLPKTSDADVARRRSGVSAGRVDAPDKGGSGTAAVSRETSCDSTVCHLCEHFDELSCVPANSAVLRPLRQSVRRGVLTPRLLPRTPAPAPQRRAALEALVGVATACLQDVDGEGDGPPDESSWQRCEGPSVGPRRRTGGREGPGPGGNVRRGPTRTRRTREPLGGAVTDTRGGRRFRRALVGPCRPTRLGSVNQTFEEHPDGDASPGRLSLDPGAAIMVEPKAEHGGFGRDHGLFTLRVVLTPLQRGVNDSRAKDIGTTGERLYGGGHTAPP